MKKTTLFLLLLLLLPLPLSAQQKETGERKSFALTHVTIIDVKGAQARRDMTVIISGSRITAIGKYGRVRVPAGFRIIDATGKFLIPGLWDMHVHLGDEEFDRSAYLPLFIANGVTGIRIMDGAPEHHLWRQEIESGKLLGPRMLIASPIIGLNKISEAEAVEEVRKAKRDGADFIKVHDNLPRASYFALMNEARRLGLSVEGHVPLALTAEEVSAAGQKSIEHLTGLDEAKTNNAQAEKLIAIFKKNRTWQCPTIIMRRNYAWLDDASFASDPRLKYVKPSWKRRWLKMTEDAGNTPQSEWAKRKELVHREKQLVGKMQRAGVPILAGTDDANPYSFPGFSLHEELALLVEAGLTPAEALQSATLNPAKFLNRLNALGTIERGKLADLVLLDANPLEDIHNTNRINAVVADGLYLDRKALDNILAEVEAAARKK